MQDIPGYPRLNHLGTRGTNELIGRQVVIQEKVDGSQISVRRDVGGTLTARSKGQPLDPYQPDALFKPTLQHILNVADSMVPGWIYRGEAFCKSKHNTLKYDRCPMGFMVLFDIQDFDGTFLNEGHVRQQATILGLEYIKPLFEGTMGECRGDALDSYLIPHSALGGTKVEGIVVKARNEFNSYGDHMAYKLVSAAFKEKHSSQFRAPRAKDGTAAGIAAQYAVPGRFHKAVQHLRDDGALSDTYSDIGALMQELNRDLEMEWGAEIREELFLAYRKEILKGSSAGFADWYKQLLDGDLSAWDEIQSGIEVSA